MFKELIARVTVKITLVVGKYFVVEVNIIFYLNPFVIPNHISIDVALGILPPTK